jgi:RimJ/RimL family protein N-acetyltransferase
VVNRSVLLENAQLQSDRACFSVSFRVMANLQTKVTLRNVVESDLAIFFEHQRDPKATAMAAFPARDREAFFLHWRTNVLGGVTTKIQTICVDQNVAGNIGSWTSEDKRLVSYWLGRSFWGQGIATAALAEFLSVYEVARPVSAFVAVHNAASIRVLEKCGFVRAKTGEENGAEVLLCL